MLDLYNLECRKVKECMHIESIVASRGCRNRTVRVTDRVSVSSNLILLGYEPPD